MCIRLRWDKENADVLHQVFEEGWTLQAYYHSMAALETMTRDAAQPIQLIMDMRGTKTPSMRVVRGRAMDESEATRSVERVIMVQPGKFMPQVDCPVHTVDTMEEAYALLASFRIAEPA